MCESGCMVDTFSYVPTIIVPLRPQVSILLHHFCINYRRSLFSLNSFAYRKYLLSVAVTCAICKMLNSGEESDFEVYILAYPRSSTHTNPFLS